MADAAAALQAEFASLEIARSRFPMWTDWGVADESVAVHSLGLTYLTTIGQAAGFVCCSEFPVDGPKIRADSVWWNGATRQPVAFFEFERHKGGDELRTKVRNLLRAYHSSGGSAELLCLVFWTKNFYPLGDEGLRDLWRTLEHGYETADRIRIPPVPRRLLRIFECLHHEAGPGSHTLQRIIERRMP
jgi:hypothetical protein